MTLTPLLITLVLLILFCVRTPPMHNDNDSYIKKTRLGRRVIRFCLFTAVSLVFVQIVLPFVLTVVPFKIVGTAISLVLFIAIALNFVKNINQG